MPNPKTIYESTKYKAEWPNFMLLEFDDSFLKVHVIINEKLI